jgi:hypothetical protein
MSKVTMIGFEAATPQATRWACQFPTELSQRAKKPFQFLK